jgi:hypothetical protein
MKTSMRFLLVALLFVCYVSVSVVCWADSGGDGGGGDGGGDGGDGGQVTASF